MASFLHALRPAGKGAASLLLMLLGLLLSPHLQAQSPANAHRWTAGDGFRCNGTIWSPDFVGNAQNLPLGIVRCASSAETESGLQAFAGNYNNNNGAGGYLVGEPIGATTVLPVTVNNVQVPCFNQQTEQRGASVNAPTNGEQIIWFNFDIRPYAGTYQFQIVTNQNVGWALYYVDPNFSQPGGGCIGNQQYPSSANGISGDLGANFSNLKYADCGLSGNGWSTITVPSFGSPTNYYLAMWENDPNETTFPNSTNLVYKSRFGCGGASCALERQSVDVNCNGASTYQVCATYLGSAARYQVVDNSPIAASSYTVTYYDVNGNVVGAPVVSATAPQITMGILNSANPAIKAVLCATYPVGSGYSITLQEDVTYTPPGVNNYVRGNCGDSFSGNSPVLPDLLCSNNGPLTCVNTSRTLSATSNTAGVTFAWTGPGGFSAMGASASASAPGTYTVTATAPGNGCAAVCTTILQQDNATPDVQCSNNGPLTCANTTRTLSASSNTAGVTFAWSGPGGFSAIGASASASAPGTYTVTATNPANGCTDICVTVLGQDITAPGVQCSNNGPLTCALTTRTVSATSGTAGVTFAWTGPGGFTAIGATATVSAMGSYTVTATNPVNGCASVCSTYVDQNITAPGVQCSNNGPLTCVNTTRTVSASSNTGGVTFAWTGPGGFTAIGATASVSAMGSYTVTATNPVNGCSSVCSTYVDQNITAPGVQCSNNGPLTCANTTRTVSATSNTAGATFAWTGPGGFTAIGATATVSAMGSYTVTATNPVNGCTSVCSTYVDQNITAPGVQCSNNGPLTCANTTRTVSATSNTGGVTFAWTGPGGFTATGPSASVSAMGSYTVTATNPVNGCTSVCSTYVDQNIVAPGVQCSNNGPLTCALTTRTVSASSNTAGATFAWTGPGGFTAIGATATVSAMGSYTVTATNPVNGCTSVCSTYVDQDVSLPNVNCTQNPPPATCSVPSVPISASSSTPGATFVWSGPNGFSFTGPSTSVTEEGQYIVTVTAPNGCIARCTTEVTRNPAPPANLQCSNNGPLTCANTTRTVSATSDTPGTLFAWTGPNGFSMNGASVTVSLPGDYTVTATNPITGCTDICVTTVDQNIVNPGVQCSNDGPLTCALTTRTVSATSGTAGVTFTWTGPGGFTATGATASVSAMGSYTVTATNPVNGCSSVCSTYVGQNNTAPGVQCSNDGPLTCVNMTRTVSATSGTAGVTFAWTGPGGFTATGPSASVSAMGSYTVTATNPVNGCSSVCSTYVGQNTAQPVCSLSAPADEPVCGSAGNMLSANATNADSYTWSVSSSDNSWIITSGANGPMITYTAGSGVAGVFKLVVRNTASGCADSCTVTINCVTQNTHCTLTQGYYGNAGGRYCTGETTTELITRLLATDLVLGGGGNTFTLTSADAACLISRMPGGGPAAKLNGIATCGNPVGITLKRGRFQNVLLAQTITLGLNMRIDNSLGGALLPGAVFWTAASTVCGGEGGTPVAGSEQMFTMPQSVLTYLGPNATIEQLYALANAALAGTLPAGAPSLASIAAAVGAINDGFDECRILVPAPVVARKAAPAAESLALSVYPNPVTTTATIAVSAAADTQVLLQVYDVKGHLVDQLFSGQLTAGTRQFTLDVSALNSGLYMARLVADGEVHYVKLTVVK